ncbi:MAG TPA: tetratricopeptide repeat protein [Acetobacteraceae bacterium]|nr:tetratricopeptide repeat protein [Acetobacteraceae bacterium]
MRLPAERLWAVFLALREIGDWDRARFAAARMLEAAGDGAEPSARRLRMAAQTFLAETLAQHPEQRGDLAAAEQLNIDALAVARALAQELDTPEARRDVSVSLNNVANAARARGDLAAAERLFGESLEIRRALAQELDTPEARRDGYVSLVMLAQTLGTRGDLDGAKRLFEQGLGIVLDLQRQTGIAEYRRDLAVCYLALAGVAEAQGDLPAARSALLEARATADAFGRQQPISDATTITAAVDDALARLGPAL